VDFVKKALMVLGVLWLIGVVSLFGLGVGFYRMIDSTDTQRIDPDHDRREAKQELENRNAYFNRHANEAIPRRGSRQERDSEDDDYYP
jgi:hypothetical protein